MPDWKSRRLIPMSRTGLRNPADSDVPRDRRAGFLRQDAPHRDICGRSAISFERLATTQAFRKNWSFTVRDMTMVREF